MKIAVFWTLFVPQVGWVFLLVSLVRLLSFLVRVRAMPLTPGILARYPLVVVPFGSSVSTPVFRCRTVPTLAAKLDSLALSIARTHFLLTLALLKLPPFLSSLPRCSSFAIPVHTRPPLWLSGLGLFARLSPPLPHILALLTRSVLDV